MNFNLIYGRSGSGKSKNIYEDLSNKIDICKNIYLIVPEQSNLTAEKKLFEYTGCVTLLNVEVLTLSRMATRVMGELSKNLSNHLSTIGKSMLIYDILSKEKKKLKFLGKSDKNVDTVGNMLTEFKKHMVLLEDLKKFNSEDKYMDLKLKDIVLIYEEYEQRISNEFIDENDVLNILAENLNASKLFDNSIIYIDDFQGFTKQEFFVFEKLLDKASEVSVTVCADDFKLITQKENDIFYFNKKFAKKLLEIAESKKANINKINLGDSKRFKNVELEFLEKNLFELNKNKYQKDLNNISIFLADNSYSELEYVAKEIIKLVRNEGYRYNEIGIVSKNINECLEDAKAIFTKYEIPLFIDTKKELNQNILIRYIISILDIYSKNWSFDSVINYLKVGLNNFLAEDIYEFENYSRKWGIKGLKWYNREFNYEPVNDLQSKLEKMRREVIEPLIELRNITIQNRTVYEITKELYVFLSNRRINQILDKKIKEIGSIELSEEYNTSYKILVQIFDELVMLFGNEKVGFEKYKELLQIGIKNSELGKIPVLQDQIILGDTERSRSNKIRALFVIGINDGVFPVANKEEGYLNDRDRIVLREKGIEIAKTGEELLYEEEFNVYRTLTLPEERLFLSYSSSDKEGHSLRASTLIKRIKRIFPKLMEKTKNDNKEIIVVNENIGFEKCLRAYKKFLEGEELTSKEKDLIVYFHDIKLKEFNFISEGANYINLSEQISFENIKRLYGKTLNTSVSRLESYRKCPFSFHLMYGLKLKEKEELKLQSIDTGSFMHDVIDEFFRRIDERKLNVKQISNEEISIICNEIIEELLEKAQYYTFSSTAKFKILCRKLKRVVIQSIQYIVYTLKNSDFEVLGHEIEFNNLSDFKPIQMSLFDDNKLEITGKIDRVDIGFANDKQYVRIIDYKSSLQDIDLNKVSAGLQIQLITYLDVLTENTDYEASGVLYLALIDNIVQNAQNLSEEEIEQELRDNFKMKGYVLADVNVIKAMDKNLENSSKSSIIPVTLKSGREDIIENRSSVLSVDEFKNLQKIVRKTIKDIAEEILNGKIDIKPYSYKDLNGCSFCNYRTICNFDTNIKGNEYNYINKRSKDYILKDNK